jgi:8-oxo-dGTP diphosphatase
MRRLNLIAVISPDGREVLMCVRRKPPYQGLRNFVGGKAEAGESSLAAAYRELREETGITQEMLTLTHFMDLSYYAEEICLEVFAGRLHAECKVSGEENALCWVPADSDFFDETRFAGEGNLGHIMARLRLTTDFLQTEETVWI